MKQLNEVRKEDDIYFSGAFWIVADSFRDILINNNISIVGEQIATNYDGSYAQVVNSLRGLTHKRLWAEKFQNELCTSHSYNYYPRGRVGISKGHAYINLPIECINAPHLIDLIRRFYGIEKLDYEVVPQDSGKMDNYMFELE